MFNSTGFSSNTTSSPFGAQSAFKPNSGFAAPVFGSTAGSSLFSGGTTQQSGGLFGSTPATSTFGQPQTTQPAFGSSTGLFGAQQNATTSSVGIFGSTPGSAFGHSKPFGFGTQTQPTGLFGQPAQPAQTQQTSLFGQPANQSSSLFGATTGFGATTATTGGTPIKFTPVTGTDTMIKNSTSTNINTRHHCITCMKEYEGKSLEELRLEDYAANRKGPQQGTQSSIGLFGSTGQSSLFGASTSTGFGTTTTGGVFGTGATGNSLFGKPAGTATAFGTPASTTTSTFGFNTTTTANPFGTNTAQKPFGTTAPQTGLFGQTTQASTGFGTQPTSGFGAFGTQQNTGGLFGASKPTFNLGTNTSTAFSFNQPSTTSTGSNLFGTKPATSTFGTFGTPATTATGFGTPAFGTTNQNTSIFGNNFGKPSTGFNFGTTPTTNTLGSGLNLGGGGTLFGNTAAKPGGLFGQNNTNLFGANTFGNTSNTFNTGSSSLGLGGNSLFGANALGNQQGGLGGGQSNSNPINQHILAYASMAYGDSPLFKNLLPQQTGKADELLKPTSPAAQKALITGQNYKAAPKNNSKIKVIPIETTKKSLFDGLDGEEITSDAMNQGVRHSPKRLVLRTRPLNELTLNQKNLQLTNIISEMSPIIRTSPRFSLRTPHSSPAIDNVAREENPANKSDSAQHDKLSLHLKKSLDSIPLENTMAELCPSKENQSLASTSASLHCVENLSKSEIANEQRSTTSSSVDSELEDTVPCILEESGNPHPAQITLRRLGYYTIPKLEQLAELVDSDGRCIVENFTIGRLNYGNLFFPDSMDVAGINLDEIVHFRHKEVVVYPDDSIKPNVGEGLNRKAQVTLDRVWPVDKTTRLPITDPLRIEAMDYEGKLRRASSKHNTKFVEYRPQTGSWVFKVDHFSKYGLSDSDEEEGADLKKQKLAQPTLQGAPAPPFQIKQQGPGLISSMSMQIGDEDEEMDDGIRSPFDLDEKIEGKALSPTSKLGRETGASSHKVQLMKASFFDQPHLNIDGEYLDYEDILEQPTYKENGFNFDSKQLVQALSWYNKSGYDHLKTDSYISVEAQDDDIVSTASIRKEEMSFEEPADLFPKPPQPKAYILKHWKEVLPYKRTTAGRLGGKSLLDMGILKGRSFSVKWGPCSELTMLSTPSAITCKDILHGRLPDDTGSQLVRTLSITENISADSELNFQVTTEPHLICALKYSVYEKTEDGCLFFTSKRGHSALHEHWTIAQQLAKGGGDLQLMSANIWGLCNALWGYLSIEDAPDSHLTLMQRKTSVSEWLKSVVYQDVSNETKSRQPDNVDDPKHVYSFLTGNQISEACEAAQKIGDHHLSLLLAQSSSGPSVKAHAQKQLLQWRETEADQYIDTARLKLMMLLAGIPVHNASDRFVNTCSNVDWLRAFAIHLWYMTPFTGSLTDALIMYDKAFLQVNGEHGSYAKAPLPPHLNGCLIDENDDKPTYDIQYHLLKLFSAKSHPLEQMLNPATHTSDHLDYRLSWFLMRVLSSLGYSHVSEFAGCLVHSSFAAQLEAEGLWHWAVFVLLHLPNAVRRRAAVQEMINRHVTLNNKCEKEDFLLNKLKVPLAWVFEAKARRAIFLERYDEAAKYLIKAELWNDSHNVIIDHIVSKAIVNENYEYLENLLTELSKDGRSKEICNWDRAGGVVLGYLSVVREIEKLVAAQDLTIGYHLEKIQPQLRELCLKIKLLQTTRPIDRLSQAEMAKRISGLIQNLIIAHWSNESQEGVNILAKLVKELPLPGDHSQWEWLRVMASWRTSTT